MKKFKKTVCMILAVILVFGCMSPLTTCTAEAKSRANGKLSISGTQNYQYAQKMLKYINNRRKKSGLSKLKLDKSLTKAAVTRAIELAIYVPQSSPHRRPNGKLSKSANSRICYEDCCESSYGYTPKEIFDDWMSSPPHKKGILLSTARSVGIGCVSNGQGMFWVLDFSNTKAASVQKSKKTVSFTRKVTVLPKYLKKSYFSINTYSSMLYVGEGRKLSIDYKSPYVYGYANLNPSSFKWTSSDPSVATVSKKGLVKAKKPGAVKITAKLKTGTKVKFSIKLNIASSSL